MLTAGLGLLPYGPENSRFFGMEQISPDISIPRDFLDKLSVSNLKVAVSLDIGEART